MNNILFLDIDGVLNNQELLRHCNCNGIDKNSIECLNEIIAYVKADIVISSAWRYMISDGAMTLYGFKYMLATHGLDYNTKIVGITDPDEKISHREGQILDYVQKNSVDKFLVIDDLNIFPNIPKNFYRTDPKFGLTKADVYNIKELWDKL